MSIQIELIRAAEFIRIGPKGRFDLAESKIGLATLAAACRKRGIQNAVLDLRSLQPGLKPVFTKSDLIELVNTFPAAGFTKQLRLAILYRSDPHKRARLFVFLSALHGWKVKAFADFEQAMEWLSSAGDSMARSDEAALGKAVRVRASTPAIRGHHQTAFHARTRSHTLTTARTQPVLTVTSR